MPTPTPDFTEIWRAVNNGHYSLVIQRMEDALWAMIIGVIVILIITGALAWFIYRNRDRIKRYFQ